MIKHPLIKVLSYFHTQSRPDDNINSFDEFYSSINIPTVSKVELNRIETAISQNKTFNESISIISKQFIFVKETLIKLLSFEIQDDNRKKYITIIYYHVISFILSLDSDCNTLMLILDSLFLIRHFPETVRTVFYLYELSIEAFFKQNDQKLPLDTIEKICVHLKSFDNYTNCLDLSIKLFKRCLDAESETVVIDLLKTIIETICDYHIEFNDSDLVKLIDDNNKNSNIMPIIHLLGTNLESENVIKLYSNLVDLIFDYKEESNIKFKYHTDFQFYKYTTDSNQKIDDIEYEFYSCPTPCIVIDENIEMCSFISKRWFFEAKKIVDVCDNSKSIYLNGFFNKFAKKIEDNTDFIMFLYCITSIKFYHTFDEIVFNVLINDFFFHPTYTIFNSDKRFNIVSFFREKIISLIVLNGSIYLPKLLSKIVDFPFLFAEIILRIQRNVVNSYPEFLCSEESFNNILVVLRRLLIMSKNGEKIIKRMSCSAACIVSHFLHKLLSINLPDNLNIRNFESIIESNIIQKSFLYLMDKYSDISRCIFIKNIFNICKNLNVKINILTIFLCKYQNTIINSNQAGPTILLSLLSFLEIKFNEELFNKVVDLITYISVKMHEKKSLKKVYLKLFFIIKKYNIECYEQMIKLIHLEENLKLEDDFLIINREILICFFSIYHCFKEYDILYSKINNLCEFSDFNIIQLNNSGIDLLLLNMIYNYPNDFDFNGYLIINFEKKKLLFKYTIPLLFRIISLKSSEIVVEKMLKIISPRDKLDFSSISYYFLEKIIQQIEKKKENSHHGYPICIYDTIFNVNGMYLKQYLHQSTTMFWIYADSFLSNKLQIEPTIYSIKLQKNVFIEIKIKWLSIFCYIHLKQKTFTFLLIDKIPENHWEFVTISFKGNSKSIDIITYLNNRKKTEHSFSKNNYHFKDESIIFEVGNNSKFYGNHSLLSCVYQIGSFIHYNGKVVNNDIIQFSLHPFCVPKYLKQNPSFVFPPMSIETENDINIFIKNDFLLSITPNIFDIFHFHYPIERFLLIFNVYEKCSLKYSLLLLKGLKYFFGEKISKSFEILPYFLVKARQNLTFKHFLILSDYLSECKTNENLYNLCNYILFNFNIWASLSRKQIILMFDYINNDIYDKCTFFLKNDKFFSLIFGTLRSFFYIFADKNPKIIKVYMKELKKLLIKRAQLKLTSGDIDTLIHTILECKDLRQTIYFIKIFLKLSNLIKISNEQLLTLQSLDFQSQPKLFTYLIKAILKTSYNFTKSIDLLCFKIENTFQFHNFISTFQKFPQIYNLCFILALKSDEAVQLELSDLLISFAIEGKIKFFKNEQLWIIWPVVFALQVSSSVQNKMCTFLIEMVKCDIEAHTTTLIFLFLKILEFITDFDSLNFQIKIIKELYKPELSRTKMISMVKTSFLVLYLKVVFNQESQENEDSSNFLETETIQKVSKITTMLEMKNIFSHLKNPKIQIQLHPRNTELKPMITNILGKLQNYKFGLFFENLISQETVKDNVEIINAYQERMINLLECQIYLYVNQINSYFENFENPLQYMSSLKIIDPIIQYKEDDDEQRKHLEQKSFSTLELLYDDNPLYKIKERDNFRWKRDFTYTKSFNSIFLKKRFNLPEKNFHNSSVFIDKKQLIAGFKCMKITISSSKKGEFLIYKDNFLLILPNKLIKIEYSKVQHILVRNRLQTPTAIEFFLTNGLSYLIDFAPKLSSQIMEKFESIHMKNLIYKENERYSQFVLHQNILQKWLSFQMTNYDFLLYLNMFSGRSFNDKENYLIFPWLLVDKKIRSFNYPINAQTDSKIDHFIQTYKMNNYIFGSSPSNPMLLAYYFLRIEPYTKLHLSIHDGKFDDPDRMFVSLPEYMEILYNSDEYKESTPEFFSFPEMFLNLNSMPIGDLKTQYENIFDLIYQFRKTLESDFVSYHLGNWIDMIWGVSQHRFGNLENINLFSPYLYDDYNKNESEIAKAMLSTLGSIPPKIFYKPISPRNSLNKKSVIDKILVFKLPFLTIIKTGFIFEKNGIRLVAFFKENYQQRFFVDINSESIIPVYLSSLRLKIPNDSKFTSDGESVYVFDEKNEKIHCISFERYKVVNNDIPAIDFILCSSTEIITATESGTVKIWTPPKFKHKTLFTITNDLISCVSMSGIYGIFVCGTNDGYLKIYSYKQRKFINSVKTNFIIDKILITESFGFILCYTPSNEINIFTINGFFIKEVKINFEVYIWSTFKEINGIDYICCADPFGNIYIFESYYPDKVAHLANCNGNVIALNYNTNLKVIVAFTAKSKVYIIPCF